MKQTIIEIEKLASLLFDDKKYDQFLYYIHSDQINNARLLIDKEFLKKEDSDIYASNNFEFSLANRLEDLVIDLIIEKMNGDRKEEQIRSGAG